MGALPRPAPLRRHHVRLHRSERYEHASEEADALFAQELNTYTEGSNVVAIAPESGGDRAHSAHDGAGAEERERELFELRAPTSENDAECSGGEIRTHNLAVNSRLLCH
jgi:hypothetical protein